MRILTTIDQDSKLRIYWEKIEFHHHRHHHYDDDHHHDDENVCNVSRCGQVDKYCLRIIILIKVKMTITATIIITIIIIIIIKRSAIPASRCGQVDE